MLIGEEGKITMDILNKPVRLYTKKAMINKHKDIFINKF